MYCQKCGERLTGLFCTKCGKEADFPEDISHVIHSIKILSHFVKDGTITTSMIQREFKLGYARAACVIDDLEEMGMIGPFCGSMPREILISPERLSDFVKQLFEQPQESKSNELREEPEPSPKTEPPVPVLLYTTDELTDIATDYCNRIIDGFNSFSVSVELKDLQFLPNGIKFNFVLSPGTRLSKVLPLQTDLGFVVGSKGLYMNPEYSSGTLAVFIPLDIMDSGHSSSVQTQASAECISDGHRFEHFVADVLSRNGYSNVVVTRGSGDFGVDITAEKGGDRIAIQCKRYSSPLGLSPIQEVYSGMAHYKCTKGMVVTNSTFTKSAYELAANTGVILIDGSLLSQMAQS